MNNRMKYLAGFANADDIYSQMLVMYYPSGSHSPETKPRIGFSIGKGPCGKGLVADAEQMLDFRPKTVRQIMKQGQLVVDGIEEAPEGWFRDRCKEAGCAWFVPFVERMAVGEDVPLEAIRAAYRENNGGRDMPCVPLDAQFSEAKV